MIYTLDDLLSRGDEYSKKLEERIRFSTEVKSKVRHKVVTNFDDFSDKDKAFLLRLKEQVFDGHDIYVFGSRINGTYLSDEEYEMYKDKYQDVKKSDWDIRSNFKAKAKEFEGFKIDYNPGTYGIKVK